MNGAGYLVGRLAAADLAALAEHRARPEWSLCPRLEDEFWIRVPLEDAADFRKLPLLDRWTSDADGQLTREGRRVPEALLPGIGWLPPSTFISVAPPLRSMPAMPPPAIAFELQADDHDQPADALLCQGIDFAAWADTAFASRLECLRFAFCEDGRAFVTGSPLPPIPGGSYHRSGRLWIPCGHRLPDHAWPELVEGLLALGSNRIAVLHADGEHDEIAEENLIPATRAAVRNTLAEHAPPL